MVRPAASKALRVVPRRPAGHAPEPAAEPDLDDAEILAALERGDPTAATSLYRRTRPQIERTVQRLLGRGDPDHDDVVQTALIAVVDSVHRFRGESSLDTWVSRIAANTVFKAIRRRRTLRRIHEAQEGEPPPSTMAPSSADTFESRDIVRRVRSVLDAMDPVKAYTVLLFDVCGYDLREVATITEASVAAAQSRLVRGRAELHERIERDPELAELLERRGLR